MPPGPRPSRLWRPEPVVSAHMGDGRYRGGALTGAMDGLRPTSKKRSRFAAMRNRPNGRCFDVPALEPSSVLPRSTATPSFASLRPFG